MKNQLHSISGVNSGLEVRVLPGSPNFLPNSFKQTGTTIHACVPLQRIVGILCNGLRRL